MILLLFGIHLQKILSLNTLTIKGLKSKTCGHYDREHGLPLLSLAVLSPIQHINVGNKLFWICDISSLGRKYSDMKKMMDSNVLKQCEVCGEIIEKISTNSNIKYCFECGEAVKTNKIKEIMRNKRNLL